jgi:hypothetical protein
MRPVVMMMVYKVEGENFEHKQLIWVPERALNKIEGIKNVVRFERV